MKNPPQLVVFTDLDGTLLDHDSYRWDAAEPALNRLAALEIPVILASSKTAAEMTILQRDLSLARYPAIVENGSGVIGLGEQDQCPTYDALRRTLDAVPPDLRRQYRGFADMSVAEVSSLTGLTEDQAQRAMQRDFSEPGLWSGSDDALEQFQTVLAAHGVTAQRGGRFLTLSFGRTKADAMISVIAALKPERTLALGDAPNDIAMLEQADHGVIVVNPHRAAMPILAGESEGRITRTIRPGPEGWNHAVNAFLDSFIPV